MKTIKAILINSENKTITEVLHDGTLASIYRLIGNGCTTFTCPVNFANEDSLYCDDESLLRTEDIKGGFVMDGWSYPIVGNALILGTDAEGDSVDAKTDIDTLSEEVIFINDVMAKDYAKEALSKPPMIFFSKD